ncbi:MAG: GNAT family N-acetyltransferase [Granulosicoccus sp.]|nr:GNAT family N-acetyltransferase [Granulosicoccus sp.]
MPNSGISIRNACTEDAQEICDVIIASVRELCHADHGGDEKKIAEWLNNKTVRNVESWIARNHTVCAVNDARKSVVGVSMLNSNQEILLNYIAPEYAKMGLGKELMKKLEAICSQTGSMTVQSTLSALAFYQSCGFRLVDADSVLLEKKL